MFQIMNCSTDINNTHASDIFSASSRSKTGFIVKNDEQFDIGYDYYEVTDFFIKGKPVITWGIAGSLHIKCSKLGALYKT